MHGSVHVWVQNVLTDDEVRGLSVAEAGSLDVNGSVRGYISALGCRSYVGTDMRRGPGVDVVLPAERLPELGQFGMVVSTEMLEHAEDWQGAVRGLLDAVEPGGLLVVTTRSKGFPYHDHPGDFHRYPVETMRLIMERAGMDVLVCVPDPEAPGVFVKARKPAVWEFPVNPWDDITLDPPE